MLKLPASDRALLEEVEAQGVLVLSAISGEEEESDAQRWLKDLLGLTACGYLERLNAPPGTLGPAFAFKLTDFGRDALWGHR